MVPVSQLKQPLSLNTRREFNRRRTSRFRPSGKIRGRDDAAASSGRHFRISDRNHLERLRCVVDVGLLHDLRLQGGV